MKMKKSHALYAFLSFSLLNAPIIASDMKNGYELFNNQWCFKYHSAYAKNPVSKVVPSLAGKPAKELFEKAKKILSGEGSTEESKIMHAAFYSPSQCDSPPTDVELISITSWISQR